MDRQEVKNRMILKIHAQVPKGGVPGIKSSDVSDSAAAAGSSTGSAELASISAVTSAVSVVCTYTQPEVENKLVGECHHCYAHTHVCTLAHTNTSTTTTPV